MDLVELGAIGAEADPDAATFARLAVVLAVASAVGRKGRKRMRRVLVRTAAIWERAAKVQAIGGPRPPLSEIEAEQLAAARFVRPMLALMRAEFGEGG